jgi:hypothetical protein
MRFVSGIVSETIQSDIRIESETKLNLIRMRPFDRKAAREVAKLVYAAIVAHGEVKYLLRRN